MNKIFQAAKEISDFMTERGWKFCVIGGLAVQRWGEPRATIDADFSLLSGIVHDEEYIQAILGEFKSRIPNPVDFALRNRVLLIQASNGTGIDVSLGTLLFEEEMIERVQIVEFDENLKLPCCTAEDLFIMKTFAARPRDWADAETIYVRQPLDLEYIQRHLRNLCELKDAPEIYERVMRMFEKER